MEQNGSPGRIVPALPGEFSRDESFDVFKEEEPGAHDFSGTFDIGEEVAGVSVPDALSSMAEGLTRKTAAEDVHHSRKAFCREGSQIAPDWSRWQKP
jgi:hypothetical protein